jgi:hypothetical protein
MQGRRWLFRNLLVDELSTFGVDAASVDLAPFERAVESRRRKVRDAIGPMYICCLCLDVSDIVVVGLLFKPDVDP